MCEALSATESAERVSYVPKDRQIAQIGTFIYVFYTYTKNMYVSWSACLDLFLVLGLGLRLGCGLGLGIPLGLECCIFGLGS